MLKRFTGGHTHKVDAQGRVALPAEFRLVLADLQSPNFIYIVPHLDNDQSHIAFSMRAYDNLIQRHEEREYDSREEQEYISAILIEGSHRIPVDESGRIVLKSDLRASIGVERQVHFVGAGTSFELWEPGARQHYVEELRKAIKDKRPHIDRRRLHE